MTKQRKAVALISGGLDSMLATNLMLQQGIHVEGLNFYTGFCVEGHTHAIRQKDKNKSKRNNALWVAEQLGIKLHIIDIIEEYKQIVINPQYGYGANLNPCLDCKIFMVGKANEWMKKHGFDFIITGEVVGQRPKSQRKETMPIVSQASGAEDLLLRPLCAKNLPETLPERVGWVDRAKLFGFNGRSRKPQILLAENMNIEEYAQPAGGCCFLTDANYSKKLSDLWAFRGEKNYEIDDIMLLKVGRHIRPNTNFKLIIGREEGENNFLSGYKKIFTHLTAVDYAGPLVLIDGNLNEEDLKLASRIVARFGQGKHEAKISIRCVRPKGDESIVQITPFRSDEIPEQWYI